MASQQPRWLILDFFAAFVRPLGSRIAIAHLIELMGMMDLDEQTVRSSVSRLKRRGWLVPVKANGFVGYRISDSALAELAEGDERVYHLTPADLADGWCVITFSIPETLRAERHKLRSKLTWWGFGNVIPGVWIAPHRARAYALRIVKQLGLEEYASVFDARYGGMLDLETFVRNAWDFQRISVEYELFIKHHADLKAELPSDQSNPPPQAAFVHYLSMLNAWRAIPFLDPGLPEHLLPADWRGGEATRLFHDLSDRLLGPALDFVRATVAPT